MEDKSPPVRKATWRLGTKQRQNLQWTVVGIICLLLFIALRPYYFFIVETRDFQTCQSNVLKIASSIRRYSEDYEGNLPLGSHWMDSSMGYLSATSGTGFKVTDLFHCPRDKSGSDSSYAYNTALEGISTDIQVKSPEIETRRERLGHPERAPLLLEHSGGRNVVLNIFTWQDVAANLTSPHFDSTKTGSLMQANGKVFSLNAEQLSIRKGKF